MLIEEWKEIKGYEEYYEVSNFGRVRRKSSQNRLHTDGILKYKLRKGYCAVTLTCNNKQKTFNIHRLVANAFIPNPNNFIYVNHIDENKYNNYVENLEWCTAKYNTNYGNAIKKRVAKRIKNGKTNIPLKAYNITNKETLYFRNMTECAISLSTSRTQLKRCIENSNKLINNIYKIERI